MTERKKLTLNRPRKASQEERTSGNPVYRNKVWMNAAPKKRLPLDDAISQISTFWPYLFPDGKLCPMKIGIQQDMWQEVKDKYYR